MKTIAKLPDHVINAIKAGQVIERPSNMLKELLENSLDANSTTIQLELINNGLDYFSITDNGDGIPIEELPNAFKRHATSKLLQFQDLYTLSTYGFRGEALASIASISKVQCFSLDGLIQIHGNQILQHTQSSQFISGTKIIINDLFYNTPVRKKFLSSLVSEKKALIETYLSFLLLYPHMELKVHWDNKIFEYYPSVSTTLQRITDYYGLDEKNIYHLEKLVGDYKLKIFLWATSKKSQISLFVNQRSVVDQRVNASLLALAKTYPSPFKFLLFLEMPGTHVDINVHPQKTSVKFEQKEFIYSLIVKSVKELLIDFTPSSPNIPNQDHMFTSTQANIKKAYEVFYDKNHRFMLFLHQDKTYLLNIQLFGHHQLNSLINNDDELQPILVALPITITNPSMTIVEERIQTLTDLGIDIDFCTGNKKQILLRSIPIKWNMLNFQNYIDCFINNNLDSDNFCFSINNLNVLLEYLDSLDQDSISSLCQNKIMVPFHDSHFEQYL